MGVDRIPLLRSARARPYATMGRGRDERKMGPMAHREGTGHASSWGYACFLTVNATSVWGGIFPFLPLEFQTIEVTLTFFLAQAVALGGAFVASMWGSYYFPHGARRMLVSLSAILLFLGSACLIAAMYVAPAALVLVAAGGVLLGIGCAGMFMLWQRYFASLPPRATSALLWAPPSRPSSTSRCIWCPSR